MPRFMGIDYGLERTGLAVSDPEGKIVFPLETMYFKNFPKRSDFFDALAQKSRREKIDALVWGLPLGMDGEENLMCVQVRNAAKRLAHRIELPYFFMPETLSSFEAEKDLRSLGLKGNKLKLFLDQKAACHILESYIRQRAQKRGSP